MDNIVNDDNLKDVYWQTGNIFEMSTGEKRLVWFDKLIDEKGFISKDCFNNKLTSIGSLMQKCVIRIYSPNKNSGYFKELIKTNIGNLLWQKSRYMFTEQEIKEKLGVPKHEKLMIIK